jgi:DNA-binding transcriptional LysR family regulator
LFDWNDLRYFLAVARCGSTLAAARMLRTSQSTVHRRLVALEKHFGCKLATPSPTGYRLTESGRRLLKFAEGAEEAIASFERHAFAANTELAGSVRVTCSSTMADRLAKSSLIQGFHARYPDLRVEFVITDKYLDLSKGEADIAIRTGEPADESLVGRKIAEVPWAVYATRSYLERHGRPARPKDINDHFVVAFDGEIANYAAARWLRAVAPRARIAARSDSWPAFVATVKTGVGLGPLPTHHGDREKGLVRLIDTAPGLVSSFWLLMHPDMRHTPRVRAFFDYVVAELKGFRALLLRQNEAPTGDLATSLRVRSARPRDTPYPAPAAHRRR